MLTLGCFYGDIKLFSFPQEAQLALRTFSIFFGKKKGFFGVGKGLFGSIRLINLSCAGGKGFGGGLLNAHEPEHPARLPPSIL